MKYEDFHWLRSGVPVLSEPPPTDPTEMLGYEVTIDRNALLGHLRKWAAEWPVEGADAPGVRDDLECLPDSEVLASLTECQSDILRALGQIGQRVTRTELHERMNSLDYAHGDSTINMALARMKKACLLDNDPKARPRGYGLTDRGRALADQLLA
jgi:hypothetical protein